MKAAGCALVIIAALMTGAESVKRDRERAGTLRELISSFIALRAEIVSRLSPTDCALKSVEASAKGQTADFYSDIIERMDGLGEQSFGEIWSSAAAKRLTALSDEELEAADEVGKCLGRYDGDTVAAVLDRAEKKLQSSLELFEARRRKEGGLRFLLPISAAVLLIVIIL